MSESRKEWPLWEVFIRSKQGLDHKHCGSLHATDAKQAIQMARDVYTRRNEGVSIWVAPSKLTHTLWGLSTPWARPLDCIWTMPWAMPCSTERAWSTPKGICSCLALSSKKVRNSA